MKEFVIQWRKFEFQKELYKWIYEFLNFSEFSGFYFDFSGFYLIARDPERWGGTMRTHGRATQAHVDAYVVPKWHEQWYRTVGIKSAIGRLKSYGLESASWATIPPILRNPTAEITRSVIRVMGHDPTDFARSDGWNHTEWNPRRGPRSTNFAQTSL